MAFDSSLTNLQNRNVLIQPEGIVPNDELVDRPILSKRISKKEIEELAVQRYRTCGQGIDFSDITKNFGYSKDKAQSRLKYYSRQGTLFTLKRTSPQRYYPSDWKKGVQDSEKRSRSENYRFSARSRESL